MTSAGNELDLGVFHARPQGRFGRLRVGELRGVSLKGGVIRMVVPPGRTSAVPDRTQLSPMEKPGGRAEPWASAQW